MNETAPAQMKQLASQLSREERSQLAAWLEQTLDEPNVTLAAQASSSLYGIRADLGPSPTAEDIDHARREVWATFPREDIA